MTMSAMRIFLSFTLLRVMYSFDLIVQKQTVSTNQTIQMRIELPSVISCVAACRKQGIENCSGVEIISVDNCGRTRCPIQCNILSVSTTENAISIQNSETIYQWHACSYASDPCEPNACYNGSTCLTIYDAPQCYENSFQCLCVNNRAGQFCEKCTDSFAGPDCDVDIRDSVLINGIYFYIPFGINVDGRDTDSSIRPNCTESRRQCKRRGMQLLTIKTAEKNASVSKLLLHNAGCVLCFYQLNLQRDSISDSSMWWWGDNQQDILNSSDFSGWYHAQPDDGVDETYVVFSPFTRYSWSDVTCTFPAYYICEYDTVNYIN
ncbi:hypothetical protein CHUAL_010929 [Chamberlinius hualienensis]